MKVRRVVALDKRGTGLYLAVISLAGTKDLRGQNPSLVVRDSPHIGGAAAKQWAITGLGQSAGEMMRRG